jgi:hypothetical protein
MPRKKTEENPAVNPTTITADADRLEKAAEKKKRALTALAEAEAMERELGMSPSDPEQNDNGQGEMIPEANLSKLERVLAELNGTGSFEVFFLSNGEEAKLGKFDIEDWPQRMETLARQKGGGTFKIVFREDNGHYAGSTTRTFDSDAYGSGRRSGSDEGGMLTRFMEIMEKRDGEHRREMDAARQENTKLMLQNQANMMEMIKSMGQGSGIARSAQDIAVLAEVLNKGNKPAASFMSEAKDMISMLQMLKEEASEPTSPWFGVVDKGFKMLMPILEAGVRKMYAAEPVNVNAPVRHSGTVATGARATLPAPVPAQAEAPASVSADPHMAAFAANLKGAITQGAEPHAVARFIVDSLPEPEGDEDASPAEKQLLSAVSDPGIVGKLIEADAALAPHIQWLAIFVNEIKECLTLPDSLFEGAEEATQAPSQDGSAEVAATPEVAPV